MIPPSPPEPGAPDEREALLREIEALAGIMVLELDAEGRLRTLPAALAALTGLALEDLRGKPFADLVHPEDQAAFAGHCRLMLCGETVRCSLDVRLAGTPPRWVHLIGTPSAGGGARCVLQDITEARALQEALQESEGRFRTMADTASCAIFTYAQTFTYVSGYTCELLGRSAEELLRTSFWEVVHPEDREKVRARGLARQRGEAVEPRYQFRILRPDGTMRWVDFTASAFQFGGRTVGMGTAFDITDHVAAVEARIALERRLLESQRLESLGLMAGGVAHDFNNLLTIILGNASLALEEAEPGTLVHTSLGSIADTAHRAADLTRQMLAYSGRGKVRREPLDLNATLKSLTGLFESTVPKRITVDYQLAPDLPALDADPTQLQQIVLNLLTNAVEAIGEAPGTVRVRTGAQRLSPDDIAHTFRNQALEPGPHLFLEVSDTGVGMDEETQRRIFDPFFTTKPTGRGLGLAAMQGIVRGHKGGIWLSSRPGKGSTFRILLPALETQVPAAHPHPAAAPGWTGHGLLLVVDDEAPIRAMAATVLHRAGFEVLTAAHGEEGVEALRFHSRDLRAVLLDISMPVMTGGEAFPALRRIRPDIPVIFTSGFEGEEHLQDLLTQPRTSFLQKPYAAADLLALICEALEG
jgi:PAS domain S-box-containing protein